MFLQSRFQMKIKRILITERKQRYLVSVLGQPSKGMIDATLPKKPKGNT